MSAAIITKRRQPPPHISHTHENQTQARDRDDELLAEIRRPEDIKKSYSFAMDTPMQILSDSLMGKMPKGDKVLKDNVLRKFSTDDEGKPVRVVLTAVGLFMSRPGEELLRDMIPLYEVVDVRKLRVSTTLSENRASREPEQARRLKQAASFKSLSANIDDPDPASSSFRTEQSSMGTIIQIRTVVDGYNSGKIYLLRAQSGEEATSWINIIRSTTQRAIMLKQAGPGLLRKLQFRVRRQYSGVAVQSFVAFLIFLSFLANIMQTELLGNGSDDSTTRYTEAFNVLEYFFTTAFTVELAANMTSNLFRPFFQAWLPAFFNNLLGSRPNQTHPWRTHNRVGFPQ